MKLNHTLRLLLEKMRFFGHQKVFLRDRTASSLELVKHGWAEPSQLRCLMVFDTQTRQFVGSGCYVVPSEPSNGKVETFETASGEFGGHRDLIRKEFTRLV